MELFGIEELTKIHTSIKYHTSIMVTFTFKSYKMRVLFTAKLATIYPFISQEYVTLMSYLMNSYFKFHGDRMISDSFTSKGAFHFPF